MKPLLLSFFAACSIFTAGHATTWTIQVANFQFTPSTVNAVAGDVIRFQWVSGFHTTTSTSVPQGATTWDAPMTSSATLFDYTVTVVGTYNYFCAVHPDMVGTINVIGSLPLKFGELLVNENTAGRVTISWKSFAETNLEKYVIKRSIDGNTFSEIGSLPARPNATGPASYDYTDQSISPGQKYYYYYVEAIDKDGSKTLSAIKLHKVKNASAAIITSISPNPVGSAGHVMIKFNAESAGSMQLILVDHSGKAVRQTQMLAVAGVNNGHWHIGQLTPGKYILKCQLANQTETTELMVVQ